jgi:hypothetical protein
VLLSSPYIADDIYIYIERERERERKRERERDERGISSKASFTLSSDSPSRVPERENLVYHPWRWKQRQL